jgi:formate-dependent nitrite reductase membrane component NrfD
MNTSSLFAATFHPSFWIPIAVFICGTIIVFVALYFAHERRRLWHETARIALEKGQPVPPNPDTNNTHVAREKSPASDVRGGLVLIAVAVGLYLGLSGIRSGPGPHLIGAYICGGIGIALLLNALITVVFARKSSDVSTRPPQS